MTMALLRDWTEGAGIQKSKRLLRRASRRKQECRFLNDGKRVSFVSLIGRLPLCDGSSENVRSSDDHQQIMQPFPSTPFPDQEVSKLGKLETLFTEWHQHFTINSSTLLKHAADDMVCDGFYPHYFSQRKRILFVGREARQISGLNYIDLLLRAYREGKWIGDQHLNVNKFHSRMLYIAYGIANGMPEWKDIPNASLIGDTFGSPDGLSFAFMNISKLSNEADEWPSDWETINLAHGLSCQSRRFNQEQVAILEPHIVITMNLGEKIKSLGNLTLIEQTEQIRSFWLENDGHRSLLIDTWHFSARNKDDIHDIYAPICNAIRRYEAHGTSDSYPS